MSTAYRRRKKVRQRPNSITAKEERKRLEEIEKAKGKSMGDELF